MAKPKLFSGPEDRRIKRALCIVAHPDDIEFYCAGTVLKLTARGVAVAFLLATSGDKGTSDPAVSSKALAKTREAEQVAAARLLGVMGEAVEVARGLGARIDPEVTRGMLLAAPDGMRSSMQKDRELGRPLEVDAIAGPIVRAGRELGVPTPQTAILMSALG